MKSITVGELKQACEGLEGHELVKVVNENGEQLVTGTRRNFGLELTIDEGEDLKAKIKDLEDEIESMEKMHAADKKEWLASLKEINAQVSTAYQAAKTDSDEEAALVKIASMVDELESDLQ